MPGSPICIHSPGSMGDMQTPGSPDDIHSPVADMVHNEELLHFFFKLQDTKPKWQKDCFYTQMMANATATEQIKTIITKAYKDLPVAWSTMLPTVAW